MPQRELRNRAHAQCPDPDGAEAHARPQPEQSRPGIDRFSEREQLSGTGTDHSRSASSGYWTDQQPPPPATEEATDSPWNSRLDTLDLTFHRSSSCRTGPMPSAPIRRMSARRAETKPRTVQALTNSKPCNHQYLAFKACCIQLPASNRCEGISTATKPGFLTSLANSHFGSGGRAGAENRLRIVH